MEDKDELIELKENYEEIKKKYSLPDFIELNKDFYIEKVSETQTDFLIREIRKFMADKFSNYLRFIEALINPSNAPMFIFSVVKSISEEDKKLLTEIYKKLAKIQVELIELDIEFVEQKEADFVNDTYVIWQEIKKDLLDIFRKIKGNWDNKSEVNGKGYLG